MAAYKLSEMIDVLRKEHGLTLEELGLKMGKSKSAMSRWIKGDRSPMVEDLEKLAHILNTDIPTLLYGKKTITVPQTTAALIKAIKQLSLQQQQDTLAFVQQLLAQTQQPVATTKSATYTLFPVQVVERLAAGIGYSYQENNEHFTLYTDRSDLKPFDIASQVSGDSMQPLIQDGDVVLIKQNIGITNGGIYAIDYDGKSYLKKVYQLQDRLKLVSINDKYDDIIVPRDSEHYLNIVGKVVDWFTPISMT